MMEPRDYQKRPVTIQAWQFDGTDECGKAIAVWCDGTYRVVRDPTVAAAAVFIPTREGTMRADAGDWIIRGVAGEFYPCKPDIFMQTYDVPVAVPPRGEAGFD